MDQFLESTDIIDWQHANVLARARALSEGRTNPVEVARSCFEWVRDEIKHSQDYGLSPVTCAASDVLEEGSGFCYAKSHLLAALLRANRIPAGLCYQRLSLDDAQFDPPVERLAFRLTLPGEADFPEIWADPLAIVVEPLRKHSTASSLGEHLPDLALWA